MTLSVLAVDDVPPALADLSRLLSASPYVRDVATAGDALTALRMIQNERYDAIFLDISMPGLDGLELASLLARLNEPPVIVFVTAFEQHAVAAFGIGAVDYLLKPVRSERLAEALARVNRLLVRPSTEAPDTMAALPVESEGRTRYVRRTDVRYVEAHGDYVRLHATSGIHLVRMPISRLEEYWAQAGFIRVHRSFLVALDAVRELRSDSVGGLLAHTDLGDVPVSRRHARDLREKLLLAAKSGQLDRR